MIRVDVDATGTLRALIALRALLADLSGAWRTIGGEMLAATLPAVPVESGALVSTLKAAPRSDGVDVTAGGGFVVYAGVQNYGWPARNIGASRFMERAEQTAEQRAGSEIESEISSMIRRVGLN